MDADIAREISDLRSEFQRDLKAQGELLVVAGVGRHEKALLRIDAVEKAAAAFEQNVNRIPTLLDREASRLEALFDEKLAGINNALTIRIDTFHELAAAMRQNSKEALEAAFATSENLSNSRRLAFESQIAKSEAATAKELDSVKKLIETTSSGFDMQITNLRDRLVQGEGVFRGGSGVIGVMLGVVIAACAVVAIVISLHNPANPNPTIGAGTKRVDDVISRLDALSVRINQLSQPLPGAGAPPAQVPGR